MKSLKMLMMAALTILSVAALAQDTTSHKEKSHKHQSEKMKYSCPMHHEVTSAKSGKCSKCGMDLTQSNNTKKKKEMAMEYTCPMHPEVVSDKPGKCPKCGMDLVEKK